MARSPPPIPAGARRITRVSECPAVAFAGKSGLPNGRIPVKLRSILILAGVAAALGVTFYYTSRPQPQPRPEPRAFVWSVEMTELARMAIALPRRGLEETWEKHEDRQWYFAGPDGPGVDRKRWGGGVPLLLSGPGANRRIAEDATAEQIERFGLHAPQMVIGLTLDDGETLDIVIGDATPDRLGYYIQRRGASDVYTVDYTWYDVLERLVTDPPYAPPAGAE